MNLNLFTEEHQLAKKNEAYGKIVRDPYELLADFMSVVESEEFAGKFLIAANTTDWLNHWLENQPTVQGFGDMLWEKPELTDQIVVRAMDMFATSSRESHRSGDEAALCCYALVLCLAPENAAREAVIRMAEEAGPQHGWLRRLLRKRLSYLPISKRVSEAYLPPRETLVFSATETNFQSSNTPTVQNSTPFDVLSEYWTLEQIAA